MKTNIRYFVAFAAICFLNLSFSYAQVYTGNDASKLVKGSRYVHVNEQRKTIAFIRLDESQSIVSSAKLPWLKDVLKLKENENYELFKEDNDKSGFVHYRFRQTYSQLIVENGVYYVHAQKGRIISANGERYADINVPVTPSLSQTEAYNKALFYFNSKQLISENNSIISKPEILILPNKEKYSLAYKFDLYSQEPLKRSYLYVDAHSGDVIKEISRICNGDAIGTAVTLYNGTQTITTDSLAPNSFRLRDYTRGNGIITWDLNNGTNYAAAVDFTDTDNFWNTVTNQDLAANDAHFGAEATYDFFFNYGRNSYDDLGSIINSYVHYSTGFVNAFWDGTAMTYGDGDGVGYSPLTSLEVIGHEITHGVTEFSAGLVYAGESGALNESFSDVFGNTIRFIYSPAAGSWLIGDQIIIPGGGGTPFRNMADPNQFQCADTYGGLWWNNGDIVHYDSGVQNFWYYLLSTGGSGVNDNGDPYLVNGIGLTDASAIAYRNLSVYLTPNSTFADARTYAVQSAIDLFGSCSNQVIQTTNAWYAVGVGGLFSNAVVAGFNAPSTYYCVLPATANFNNTSLNATSYEWDFGDGGTSTATNPSHIYTSAGVYTVRLIASGAATCASVDTLEIINFISVTNGGGPLSPACTPATINNCCGIGITNFIFNTINKTSGNGSEGYKDYTCSNATTITAGDAVAVQVTTALTAAENVKAFIDYNNDGSFNTGNEMVYSSSNIIGTHNGVVNTPTTAVLNTPLRMRVMDDAVASPIANSCNDLQNGQAEDYTITFLENTQAPEVDFTSNIQVVTVTGSVNFFDLSIHAPLTWEWQFPGGTPSTSILQNPTITYNTQGVYDVELKVTNTFGEDSVIKAGYISVVNTVNMCFAQTSTTAPNGILYDSGGPTGNYLDNQNCTFLIQPACADTVILSFSAFAIESGWDYFRVYDGTSAAAPLLLNATGTSIPPPVKAPSGSMFINFTTDGSVVMPGFEANWSTVTFSAAAPVAAFTANDPTPPLNVAVQFTDQSTNAPNAWLWDFGDGNTSTDQNPTHPYTAPGIYTVQMIAYTCSLSDTTTGTVTVQGAPGYSVNPDSINVAFNCGDSITVPLTIYNTGGGDLVFDIEIVGNGALADTSVLVIQEGSSWGLDMPTYLQTNFGITPDVILSSQISVTDFSLYNIIITVGAQSATYYTDISNNKTKFETFVSAGGIVSHQMATFSGTPAVNLAGGAVLDYGNNQNINTGLIPAHPLLIGISNPLNGNNANHCYFTTVPAGAQVVTETGTGSFPTTLEYNYGNGKVIATGMTWEYLYINAYNSGPMLPNSITYILSQLQGQAGWITISQEYDTTQVSDSTVIYVTINSTGLDAGTYTSYLIITTNDPLNPIDSIPVTMTISGPAVIALNQTCLNFGSVMQNTSVSDSVLVYNHGCDTLVVSSVSSGATEFALQTASSFSIAPHDSAYITVTFTPTTVGTFSSFLTILNSDQDTVVCLDGSSFAAPVLTIIPPAVTGTVNSCNDSVTVAVQIINSGGGILHVTLEGDGDLSGQIEVLALTYGTDLTTEYPNTIAAINQYFTNYNLTTINTTSASALQTALAGKDVLLITEPETGTPSVYTGFATVLQNFVSSGGSVIMCAAASTQSDCLFNTSLISGTYAGLYNGLNLDVINTSHPITAGLPLSFIGPDATFGYNITNPNKVALVTVGGVDIVSYRPIGNGYAIFLAFDYWTPNHLESNRIVGQTMDWLSSQNVSWLSISLDSTDVIAGDTTTVYVTMYSAGLNNGTYTAYILVGSNDPLNPVDTIPVTFTVAAPPCMDYIFSIAPCNGTVSFTDSSSNSPTTWLWDFGDGGSSLLQNPTHQYTATGTYNVKLIACNVNGCDSLIQTVNITSLLIANFSFTGTMIAGQPVTFTNTSVGATFYLWNFGDGSPTSTLQNPVHTYLLPGTYIVTLSISGGGCNSLFTDTLIILPVGIYNPSAQTNISVYPNPVKDEASIDVTTVASMNISIEVFDVAGRLEKRMLDNALLAAGTHKYVFKGMRAGVYFVVVTIDGLPNIIKVVKTN